MEQNQLEQLASNLRSKRINERKAALDELATLDSHIAIPLLKKLTQEKDFGLRCLAMMGFRNHLTEDSFAYLSHVLSKEEDHSVLAEAANSIYDFGDKAIAPLQELYARCQNWLVRHTVIAVLVETDEPQILLSTAQLAVANDLPMTKQIGITALQKLVKTSFPEEAWELFAKLAVDQDWQIRQQTAIALRNYPESQAKKLLAQLQQDENYQVVAAALEQND